MADDSPKSSMDLSRFEGTTIFQSVSPVDPSDIFGPAIVPEPIGQTVAHDLGGWGDFNTLRESLLPRIFGHMVQLATPVVKEFHGDLFHDAEWLRKNIDGPCSFEFLVRTSGTNVGESARIMVNIGAPGAILYRLTVAMEERRQSWSLTIEEV